MVKLKFKSQASDLISHNLTDFQIRVLQATAKIPYGKVTTYQLLAKAIDKPKASRAVGNALHINPLAPSIPCHRVVQSSGGLGGYGGGGGKKYKLLTQEGIKIYNNKIKNFGSVIYKFN